MERTLRENSFELRIWCLDRYSPLTFVEYLTLQYLTSLVFLRHQETTWYLHTRTFVLYQGQNLLYNNHDTLTGVWQQPDGNQTSLYLVHQQRSELILHAELASVPIRSKCDLPHADNNLQEDMPNSIVWRRWRLPLTDLQPVYRGSACAYKGLLGDDRRTLTMSTDILPYTRKIGQRTGGWQPTISIINFGIQLIPRHKRDGTIGSASTIC